MNKITKELLLEILDSSSDDDDYIFEEFFSKSMSSNSLKTEDEDDYEVEQTNNSKNFMDIIDKYSDVDFKTHLKLKRSTVEKLVTQYAQSEFFANLQRGGKRKIGIRREVYLYVWYITNTITFRELGDLFGIVNSSAWSAVGRVTSWLFSKGSEYIKWPQGEAIAENCRKFEEKNKLAGVIGAIGSTHIIIAAPKENVKSYYDNEKNFSLVLQAVVDADYKFIDICCGEPGSLTDSRVLRRSILYKKAQTSYDRLFPCNTFLLGSSFYAGTNWIVSPYKDDGKLTDQQRSFNCLHSDTWVVVENTFEMLKGRFRRLGGFIEQRKLDSVKKIIASACILHNFCIINNDHYCDVTEEKGTYLPPERKTTSTNSLHINRRQKLFDYLDKQNII